MRRVLIVDDDAVFADTVADELRHLGYAVDVAPDEASTDGLLAGDPAHVVLLDVRLRGPGGDTDGLALAPRILSAWPYTRVLVVSGYTTSELVDRAFDAGAVEVLPKDPTPGLFAALLRHKVRRAADDAERDLTADPARRERALRDAWRECRTETDRNRKGVALERVVGFLFASLPGLRVGRRVANGHEEFDLLVANESPDPLLQKEGSVWLVECKNWSNPVGVPAVRPLIQKMGYRYGRCRLGFAVSLGGFAETVREDLTRASGTDVLVVALTGPDLEAWIDAADRTHWLKDRLLDALAR